MAHIHYKFSSKLSYDTVIFDGPHITLKDLKRQIMGREKLRAGDCDLQITNGQTKEEYTEDDGLIPKGSSVIVRRVPIRGIKSNSSSKTNNIERLDGPSYQAFGASRATDDQSSTMALSFFSKMQMANLVDADVSEEDKIRVMINQSCYNPINFSSKLGTVLPDNYTCYRCGNTGHHIRNCPTSGDKTFEGPQRIKKSTGIPRSFMVEVDDPSIKGVMLTNCGRFAIPAIDAEAYAIGKKEKPPFVPQEQAKSEEEDEPIPDELLCLICHDLLSDAVVIPCCGNSYCDECIRTALLDSEDHVCPTCGQLEVSPDTLIANKFLRQAVNNFKKEQGSSSKRRSGPSKSKTSAPVPSPVPTPPPLSFHSLVQKPLQPACSHQENSTQVAKQDETVEERLWNSSLGFPTGSLTESNTQQPSSSATPSSSTSSYSTTPSPLFPSPLFHTFIPTHQPHSNYPPGYQPTTPVWTLPAPKGAPIPSLCPSTSASSVSALNPNEWYSQQRKERSPHRCSSHAKSSKSKPSRSYSRSTSRSGSRSRSRSRPRSSYSSNRDYRSRFHSSISHRYGYKRPRSPTPSSSSSSRGGYESRSNSSSDHQKSRHHSKRSASRSRSAKRGKEKSGKEAGGSTNSQHTNDMSSLELDRQRYLQWTKEYQEWYEKYFSSYITHFHQLPLPPSPYPQDPRYPPPGRWMTGSVKDCSPSSESSCDSRSPSYKSSSDSHSSASHSLSDSCHSPPSHSSSNGRSSRSKDRAALQERKTDNNKVILQNVNSAMKHAQKRTKKLERGKVEDSFSSDSGDCTEDSRKGRKSLNTEPNARKDDTDLRCTATASDALEPVQPSLRLDHPLDQDYEKKPKKETFLEREQGRRRGEDSDSMQDLRRKHKIKHSKQPGRTDRRREDRPGSSKDPDSLLENKRKGADADRKGRDGSLAVKPQKAETSEEPGNREREPPKLFSRKKQNTEEKRERKWSLTEKDIWEGGIKVMAHKKISININLDGKRKEEKTDEENSSQTEICSQETTSQTGVNEESCNGDKTETELNEKGESSQENITGNKIKPDEQGERRMWHQVTCRDDQEEEWEKNAVDEDDEKDGEKRSAEEEDLWHGVHAVGKEEGGMGKEEAERVRGECREEMDRWVLTSQEQRAEEGSPCRGNGDDQQREEDGSARSSSPRRESRSHHDGSSNIPDDSRLLELAFMCL
ncbi:E3 ubiquitin-protein ligase RBBP6 [Xenentodon cancila]